MSRPFLSLALAASSLGGCMVLTPPTEGPRVAATGENVDHYGRPTDPNARECYDQCMSDYDTFDSLVGPSHKNDDRQKQTCWDRCAPAAKVVVCQKSEVRSCSCPNPAGFSAAPITGTRTCVADQTRFGGCDCNASDQPSIHYATYEEMSSDDPCKKAILGHCTRRCAEPSVIDREPCETACIKQPVWTYDGRLKECTGQARGNTTSSDTPRESTASDNHTPPTAPEASCKKAIGSYCTARCSDEVVVERGPCEVACMREPFESYDGKLKECTPDLVGY